MNRIKSHLKKLFISIGIVLLSLIIMSVIALNSTLLQTECLNYWLNLQSKTMHIEARVRQVNVDLFSRNIVLNGLEVYDHHQNLLIDLGTLKTSVLSFSASHLSLGETHIDGATFRLHRYDEDSIGNFQRILDFFKPETRSDAPDFAIKCAGFYLDDGNLSYVDDQRSLGDTFPYVDFNHVFLSQVALAAKHIDIVGDNVLAVIENLSFKEQKGFEVFRASTRLSLSSSGIIARETSIITPFSDLDFDLRFKTQAWDDYQNFISKVYMFSKFRASELDLKDVVYFAPEIEGMQNQFGFSGHIWGHVNHFQTQNFVCEYGRQTQFNGDILMSGLPDFNETYCKLSVRRLTTNAEDIETFLLPDAEKITLPKDLQKLGTVDLSGEFSGYPNNLNASVDVISDAGEVQTDLNFAYDKTAKTSHFSGQINHSKLALQHLLNEKTLGENLRVTGSFDGTFSTANGMELFSDLICENIEYQTYALQTVALKSNWKHNVISTAVSVNDSKGTAQFTGEWSIDPKHPYLRAAGSFNKVDLHQFQIWNDTNQPLLSSGFKIDLSDFNLDSAVGNLNLSNLQMELSDTAFFLNEFAMSRQLLPQGFFTTLNSDFFKTDIWGDYSLTNLRAIWDDIRQIYLSALKPSGFQTDFQQAPNDSAQNPEADRLPDLKTLNVALDVFKTDGLLSYFLPNIRFPKGADLALKYDDTNRDMFIKLHAETMSAWGFSAADVNVNGITKDSVFQVDMNTGDVYVKDKHYFEQITLQSELKNNAASWQLHWRDSSEQNSGFDGDFEGFINVLSNDRISLNISKSQFQIVDQIWQFDPTDTITISSHGIYFQNIHFFNRHNTLEYMKLDGEIAKAENSRLNISFNDYRMDTWMPLVKHIGLDFSGKISGDVNIFDIFKNLRFSSDLEIEDFRINDFSYGTAHLKTTIDERKNGSFLTFDMIENETSGKTFLAAKGYFIPTQTKENFDIDIDVRELDLSFLKNYVTSFSSSLTGQLEGQLTLKGDLKKPLLNGELKPHNAVMKIDYLNTSYAVACDKIIFSLDSIMFRSANLEDVIYKTQGDLYGGLYHQAFQNFRVDLGLDMQKLFVLNTTFLQNEDFYGKAFGTGSARISGPVDNLVIDVQARSERGTDIYIPYSTKINVSKSNQFIRFASAKDTVYENITSSSSEEQPVRLTVKLNVDVTPEALFTFDMNIPPTVGVINASGSGNLRLNVDTKGEFTMFGDYTMQDGYYDFSFEEKSLGKLITKRFHIERGGTMQWTGDPANMIMDISAIYTTKASLYPVLSTNLISEEESLEYKRKVNVQSVIGISGRMAQPHVKFDFRLPNVDENYRTEFFSLINRDDETEMLKQTLYLLLLGNFTAPGNNSSIAANSNPTSMVWEVLFNQINNIVQNIFENVNIGFNYKPEDLNSTQETQLSWSTQFLNNRLLFDGNIGSGGTPRITGDGVPETSQEIMAEVNAEWKITNKFSLKAFNRSNERDLAQPQSGYSQGIGISYKRDFDSFKSMFRRRKERD